MNKYELLYIISSTVAEEAREAIIEKYKAYVESHNGTVESVDKWGMKKFAYPINFQTEGYYVLMNITLAPNEVDEMNKQLNINENIVRQIFVRK